MYDLYDDNPAAEADLDSEIDLLLKSEQIGEKLPESGQKETQKQVLSSESPEKPEGGTGSAPLTVNLPPELLTQGSALAKLAEQYLGNNAAALKAITDKLAETPSTAETPEQRQERITGLIADFFKDPEKTVAKLTKPAPAAEKVDLSAALIPAYEAKGDRIIERFLNEMRDSSELAFDKKLSNEIEREFRAAASKLRFDVGSFEAAIGRASTNEAREVLNQVYARAVGEQAIATRKESTKTGKVQNIAGGGGATPQTIGGVSGAKLEMAKKTALGLATGDDGKINAEDYKTYLKLALGKEA